MKLLNPGPVTLTARVRNALLREDMCHREPEFAALSRSVIERLGRVYAEASTTHVAVLLTGSGTAAVEAMLGSLVPKTGKVLVVANGVYGERAAAMLAAQGKAHDVVKAEWLAPMDLAAAEKKLASGGYTHVVAVHHETTTGRLNDVAALGALCKRFDVPLLLDAVSSFGGEEIRFEAWNLLACAATANKCLHGVPGIAFVLARKDAFAEGKTSGATSVYLDLFRYKKEQDKGWSPFTQAVQPLFALDEALDELADQGGWEKRRASYRARTERVMSGLRAMGVEILLESPSAFSSILTGYRIPKGHSYEALHDALKKAGFVIYAGQGNFQGAIFRVAVMGDLTDADLDRVLAEIRGVLAARAGASREVERHV